MRNVRQTRETTENKTRSHEPVKCRGVLFLWQFKRNTKTFYTVQPQTSCEGKYRHLFLFPLYVTARHREWTAMIIRVRGAKMFVFWPDFLFVCPCRRTAPATARARTTSSSSRHETTWAWPSSPCSAASGPWESQRSTSRRGWGCTRTHTHTPSHLNDAASVLSRFTIFSWIPRHTSKHKRKTCTSAAPVTHRQNVEGYHG